MNLSKVEEKFPELHEIEQAAASLAAFARVKVEGVVQARGRDFPIYSFAFGPDDPTLPALLLTGGVHGLERVGTHIVTAFLRSIGEMLPWDEALRFTLANCRLLVYPLVNPAGMFQRSRSNAHGVDLMRNAPVDAAAGEAMPLVGGHRLSAHLPWYRGRADAAMEAEAQLLCDFVRRELFAAPFSLALDVHSGFGMNDRIWSPFARTKALFANAAEFLALKKLLDRAFPNHVYIFEPQSRSYVTHGDLWDYLYLEHRRQGDAGLFLPLALEIGSWLWIKKNPRQLFSILGVFNPILPHRRARALRRHTGFFDFLLRATSSHKNWLQTTPEQRAALHEEAVGLWMPGPSQVGST